MLLLVSNVVNDFGMAVWVQRTISSVTSGSFFFMQVVDSHEEGGNMEDNIMRDA